VLRSERRDRDRERKRESVFTTDLPKLRVRVRAHTGSSLPGGVPGEEKENKRNESQINKETSRTNTVQAITLLYSYLVLFPSMYIYMAYNVFEQFCLREEVAN
jgi:hypothetical protein